MIIASPAKKEISIPLQPMTSAVSSLSLFEAEEAAAVDLVSVKSRNKSKYCNCIHLKIKPLKANLYRPTRLCCSSFWSS